MGKEWIVNSNISKKKLLLFHCQRKTVLPFIGMADTNLQEVYIVCLHIIMFSADMMCKDFIESVARSAASNVDSLCLFCIFISLPFVLG